MHSVLSKIFNTKNAKNPSLYSYYVSSQYRDRYSGPYDYNTIAREGFLQNIIVFRAVNMIAKSASSVALVAYKSYTSGKKKELTNHQVTDLLKNPNSKSGLSEFLEQIVAYQLIAGNAYVHAVSDDRGIPVELQILRPDRVKIAVNNDYLVYKYSINGSESVFGDDPYGICDILHIKNFHPLDDLYGMSGIAVAHKAIEQHNECLEWNRALLKNGARPCGAVVMGGGGVMSDEQFERMKCQINEQVTGGENAGKIMLLEGGLDWREMSMSPKDMDFMETKNGSARDIALALGVPPQLLGIPGDNTYSNMSEARMAFWEETVLPMLNNICGKLSVWLSGHFAESIDIAYDIDTISALSAKRQMLWQNLNSTSFLSEEEKRQMLGFGLKAPQN